MRLLSVLLLALLTSCQIGRGVPHPNWNADCGPAPHLDPAEIVAAAKKAWWWGSRWAASKDVVTLGPARAVWTLNDGPPEYGYVSLFVFVPKGQKEYDLDQIPCYAFYQHGAFVGVGRMVDRKLRLTILDDEDKNPTRAPAAQATK